MTEAEKQFNKFVEGLAKQSNKNPEEVLNYAIVNEYRDWIRENCNDDRRKEELPEEV